MNKVRVAIDGNEANVDKPVGSNVYAYELLRAMAARAPEWQMTVTVLLAAPPLSHLPPENDSWHYEVVTPSALWTQWAAPLYLEKHQSEFDVFFTPGHYAPRRCPIPYVSSVMDTAYLDFPHEFKLRDRIQLKEWTEYSVTHAAKVIAISRFTKRKVCEVYKRAPKDVVVAYPAVATSEEKLPAARRKQLLAAFGVTEPFFLYVGTIQPRKRLPLVITAFANCCTDWLASVSRYRAKKDRSVLPQLVIAGKIGWLAGSTLQKARQSPFHDQIKMLGYVDEQTKQALLQQAAALILVGRHEGFGIPPLEAMQAGTIPIVARTGSLPEVVGQAGMLVAADDPLQLTNKMKLVLALTARERSLWLAKGRQQAKQFNWQASADVVCETLAALARGERSW